MAESSADISKDSDGGESQRRRMMFAREIQYNNRRELRRKENHGARRSTSKRIPVRSSLGIAKNAH